jgi:signal transduction histidine kinase
MVRVPWWCSARRRRLANPHSTQILLDAESELALHREHDRLASDLHDLTIQRVFGLGLTLASLTRRHPELESAFAPLIAETDQTIRELRTVIFDISRHQQTSAASLRGRAPELAHQSARALGFDPTVAFRGPVDTLTRRRRQHGVAHGAA